MKDMNDGTHAEIITAGPRTLIDQLTITAPATTGVTLASLCTGAAIPAGAVVAEIQAIGGAVRVGLKNGTTVTPTTGYKIDMGADTPCVPEFKSYAEQLMHDANLLHVEVGKAYADRWADLVPPTLEECQAFIAAIIHETSNQEYTAT